jgi:alpha/beta hydrolase fold
MNYTHVTQATLVGVVSLLLAGSPTGAQSAPAIVTDVSSILWEPYTFISSRGDSIRAEFGRLAVPEYRANPHSRKITLALVRLPSTAAHPGPPLVYLDGGPGNSGIKSSRGDRFPMFMALRTVGDVILFDHRGVGQSSPDMSCSGTFDLSFDRPLSQAEYIAVARRLSRQCADSVRRKGVDLRGYTVKEA